MNERFIKTYHLVSLVGWARFLCPREIDRWVNLPTLELKQHPDKNCIGKLEQGFDFLSYHFSRQLFQRAAVTVSKHVETLRSNRPRKKLAQRRWPRFWGSTVTLVALVYYRIGRCRYSGSLLVRARSDSLSDWQRCRQLLLFDTVSISTEENRSSYPASVSSETGLPTEAKTAFISTSGQTRCTAKASRPDGHFQPETIDALSDSGCNESLSEQLVH